MYLKLVNSPLYEEAVVIEEDVYAFNSETYKLSKEPLEEYLKKHTLMVEGGEDTHFIMRAIHAFLNSAKGRGSVTLVEDSPIIPHLRMEFPHSGEEDDDSYYMLLIISKGESECILLQSEWFELCVDQLASELNTKGLTAVFNTLIDYTVAMNLKHP